MLVYVCSSDYETVLNNYCLEPRPLASDALGAHLIFSSGDLYLRKVYCSADRIYRETGDPRFYQKR